MRQDSDATAQCRGGSPLRSDRRSLVQNAKRVVKTSALSASLGLTLAWPLLDGFENRYRTRQTEAATEAARLRVQLLEESIRLQARRVWADVQSTAEEIRGVRESVELAREAHMIAEVRYRSGLSTQIEVLDADVALNRARLG